MTDLTAFALVCSLTPSPEPSSSDLMARHILDRFEERGITTSSARVVDHEVAPGVQKDMGNGDEWPMLREKILAADILVLSTPIWVGHPSSLAQRVMERLDADIAEMDEEGRPVMAGKVAVVAVVGNEDGAHKTVADMMQGLNDIGFSLPSQGSTYWVGEAMQTIDFKDLAQVPEVVATTTAGVVRNAHHLAKLLRQENFPPE